MTDGEASVLLLQEGGPFQGPELGSCLTLRNELSEETHVLTKQEILLGKGTWVESSRVREPRRTALWHGLRSQFYGDGISFRVVFSQSFWLRDLPGGARLVQPRWMPERILGGGRTGSVSFWPFSNFSGWWRLISSLFLTGTSCHKTTHANGYYGAWPGWAVSISVLPLRLWSPDIKRQLFRKDPNAGKDWWQEEKRATDDEMVDSIIDSMNINLNKLQDIVKGLLSCSAAVHRTSE